MPTLDAGAPKTGQASRFSPEVAWPKSGGGQAPLLLTPGMRNLTSASILSALAALATACTAPSEPAAAVAEASFSDRSCLAGAAAERELTSDGFVRTWAGGRNVNTSGLDLGFHEVLPLYRYEHADGRVQYADCKGGRMGPAFPVKNAVSAVSGTWRYGPDSTLTSAADLRLLVHGFEMSEQMFLRADLELGARPGGAPFKPDTAMFTWHASDTPYNSVRVQAWAGRDRTLTGSVTLDEKGAIVWAELALRESFHLAETFTYGKSPL